MFGYAAFAQPPFAALGSTQFVISITETINAMNDTNAEIDVFYEGVVEGMTSLDFPVIHGLFIESINESINSLLDSSVFTAQFIESVVEAMSILDSPGETYWIKINDITAAGWTAINSSQAVTWSTINDSQGVTWVKINNSQ